jgi:hypothetical protein
VSGPYAALRISVTFIVEGANDHAEYAEEWHPLRSDIFDAAEIEARRPVFDEIRALLAPLYAHLASIGGIRADDVACDHTPVFYLFVEGEWQAPEYRDAGDGAPRINFGRLDQPLSSLPGATLRAHSFAEHVSIEDAQHGLQTALQSGKLSCWGGEKVAGKLPQSGEAASELLERVAVPSAGLVSVFDRLAQVGYHLKLYSLFFDAAKVSETEWLVEGVIAFGAITLFVGSGAAGKSSALHELLSATRASDGPKLFFGQVVTGRYPAALLSGEENSGSLKFRQERHATVWKDAEPMVISGSDRSDLLATLKLLELIPGPGLLVVDPVTVFLEGDETKTHVVSEFYGPLQTFARQSGWAVVVVHHLVKDPPKSLSRILPSVKGSTVHTDRARMVIAMIDRRNGCVEVGPIKHNFPEGAWLQIDQGQFLRRYPEAFRLLPVDAEIPKAPQPECELLDLIHSVVASLNFDDETVHRTGSSGLYKLQRAELQGVPRNVIESGILSLLDAGRLINTAKGLVAVQSPAPTNSSPKEQCQ